MNPLFGFYFKMNKYLYIQELRFVYSKIEENKGNIYAL